MSTKHIQKNTERIAHQHYEFLFENYVLKMCKAENRKRCFQQKKICFSNSKEIRKNIQRIVHQKTRSNSDLEVLHFLCQSTKHTNKKGCVNLVEHNMV